MLQALRAAVVCASNFSVAPHHRPALAEGWYELEDRIVAVSTQLFLPATSQQAAVVWLDIPFHSDGTETSRAHLEAASAAGTHAVALLRVLSLRLGSAGQGPEVSRPPTVPS